MWGSYTDPAPAPGVGCEPNGWGSNPARRFVGEGTSLWVEELACCLCGCLSAGPVFIIVGFLFLVRRGPPLSLSSLSAPRGPSEC
jgi:hypothetical protein